MSSKYYNSPQGLFQHPWVNKPDTKFSAEGSGGMFKVKLILEGHPAETLKEKLDADVDAAWEDFVNDPKTTPKDIKAYKKGSPYVSEEDDNGNPTGRTIFQFKQNAVITLKDGTKKHVTIGIYDAANKAINTPVFNGTVGVVSYATRPYRFAKDKVVSVRLDFAMVQVIKVPERGQSGGGSSPFDTVEGGYVYDGDDGEYSDPKPDNAQSSSGADY